jgi:hypothetical protein
MSVHRDLKPAAGRRHQLNLGVRVFALQLGCQTGSPRLIVSNDAVFDDDAHDSLLLAAHEQQTEIV